MEEEEEEEGVMGGGVAGRAGEGPAVGEGVGVLNGVVKVDLNPSGLRYCRCFSQEVGLLQGVSVLWTLASVTMPCTYTGRTYVIRGKSRSRMTDCRRK